MRKQNEEIQSKRSSIAYQRTKLLHSMGKPEQDGGLSERQKASWKQIHELDRQEAELLASTEVVNLDPLGHDIGRIYKGVNMDNKSGSGDKVLDWVIIVAAVITFIKTADVFSFFSPGSLNAILGMDVSYIYGIVNALLVEGAMLTLHFNRRAHGYKPAEISKWALLVISMLCQIFDGFLTTNTLAQQGDELKFVFQYGIPALPIVILVMIFAIGHLPESGERVASVGLKNRLPNWRRLWHGDEAAPLPVPAQVPSNPREKKTRNSNWQRARKNMQKTDLLFVAGGDIHAIMAKYKIAERTAYNWQGYAKKELKAR